MSEYGLELRDEGEQVVFNLTNRMTNLIWSKTVGAHSSGEAWIKVPAPFKAVVHAVPITSDGYLRHIPHKISFNANTGRLTWVPGLEKESGDRLDNFKTKAVPRRSASRIHVIGYVES